jgi:hypothetical protein
MSEAVAAPWRTTAWFAVASALVAAGCAGPGGERKTEPAGISQGLVGVRLRVRRDPGALDQEVGAALETELARAGVAILTDERFPRDADVILALDLRSVGPVVEGIATASVERDGVLIDRVSTALDVYRRDHFPGLVARELAEALARSPRVAGLSGRGFIAAAPPPTAASPPQAPPAGPISAPQPQPPPVTISAPPQPMATQAPIPSGPAPLGRSGRFGAGVGLELQLGWAQVVATGGSPAGVHLALALQIDMGPRAAFRLPLSLVAAGSGENEFAEIAFTPTFVYRFRYETEQTFVPYVGLGVALEFVDAGRGALGRPVTGMRSPDSCSSRSTTSTVRDCAFAISPAPIAGVEWHANRLFALDLAASYSFAHLTSSTGLVSWIHLLSVFVGPRVSF